MAEVRQRALVVVHSVTGNTLGVAEAVARELGAELVRIRGRREPTGVIGIVTSGFQALTKRPTKIDYETKPWGTFDLVILAAPVWAGRVSVPMRSFLMKEGQALPPRVALVMTSGQEAHPDPAFHDFEAAAGHHPVATLHVPEKMAKAGDYAERVSLFCGDCAGVPAP